MYDTTKFKHPQYMSIVQGTVVFFSFVRKKELRADFCYFGLIGLGFSRACESFKFYLDKYLHLFLQTYQTELLMVLLSSSFFHDISKFIFSFFHLSFFLLNLGHR